MSDGWFSTNDIDEHDIVASHDDTVDFILNRSASKFFVLMR